MASWSEGVVNFTEETGRLTDDHRRRIRSAVEETPYYDLKGDPSRFYLVDSFIPTDAKKTSPGGIMGLRYLDLSKLLPAYNPRKDYTSEELAAALERENLGVEQSSNQISIAWNDGEIDLPPYNRASFRLVDLERF